MAETTMAPHPLESCRPLGDRLIVRVATPRRHSPGGIALPDSAVRSERPQVGTVIAAGPGRKVHVDPDDPVLGPPAVTRVPMDVAEGDVVLFLPYTGTKYEPEGWSRGGDVDFLVLREDDVLGIFAAGALPAAGLPD